MTDEERREALPRGGGTGNIKWGEVPAGTVTVVGNAELLGMGRRPARCPECGHLKGEMDSDGVGHSAQGIPRADAVMHSATIVGESPEVTARDMTIVGFCSERPVVSICATAAKPEFWHEFMRSIGTPEVPYEVVFVGPYPPLQECPSNFHWIESNVKPSQCYEIAWRAARGQYILHMADDLTFLTPNPLDQLLATWVKAGNPRAIVSCRYMLDGVDYSTPSHNCHVFVANDRTSPAMPVGAFMRKSLLEELGGVDRRFTGVCFDLDIAMRAHAAGGTVVIDPEVYIEELTRKGLGRPSAGWGWWSDDHKLLMRLWKDGEKLRTHRRDAVLPFELNASLYIASQGKRGRWRGDGPLWWEDLENRFRTKVSANAPLFHLLAVPIQPWRWVGIFRRRVLGRPQ